MYRLVLGGVPVLRRQLAHVYMRLACAVGVPPQPDNHRPIKPDTLERWILPAVAGALAGAVAIGCERRGRRTGVSQEVFAR